MDQSNLPSSEYQPGVTPQPMRRRPDAASALSVSLALPEFTCSLALMSLVGTAALPSVPWLLPVLWILSGVVLVMPSIEPTISRLIFDIRPPGSHELRSLAYPWQSVCQVAGVDPARYVLMVEDSHGLNAFAVGGRTVSVTQSALQLPPKQLEAVLAHELGHHLSGHPVVSMLAWWYALPARGAAFLVGLAARFVLAIGRVLAVFGSGTAALASLLLALMILAAFAFLSVWLILVPLTAPLLAWASRLGEIRADRMAALLGYGPHLIEVLHIWINMDGGGAHPGGLRGRLLSTHPSHTDRIRHLHEFLR
jgi:Zn-dependent protease with chaperone function